VSTTITAHHDFRGSTTVSVEMSGVEHEGAESGGHGILVLSLQGGD
jgi:hypothetical protein